MESMKLVVDILDLSETARASEDLILTVYRSVPGDLAVALYEITGLQ